MTREFCDRCDAPIKGDNWSTGFVEVVYGKERTQSFTVELRIRYTNDSWKLCKKCAHEIMERAFLQYREKAMNLVEK